MISLNFESAIFLSVFLLCLSYFIFARRTFDLFLIGFGGLGFYFSPLVLGYFPRPGDRSIMDDFHTGSYVVGISLLLSLVLAAVAFDRTSSSPKIAKACIGQRSLAPWYLAFSLIGLVMAFREGSIVNLDKLQVLEQVGYWFVLFEICSAMAVIESHWRRSRWQFVFGCSLLFVDLLIGFRGTTIMTVIACVLLEFGGQGEKPLWKNSKSLAIVFCALLVTMLIVNPVRYAVFPLFTPHEQHAESKYAPSEQHEDSKNPPSEQHEDSKNPPSEQHEDSKNPPSVPVVAAPIASTKKAATQIAKTLTANVDSGALILDTEPFVTQAILSEVIRRDFKCEVSHLKDFIYAIPFMGPVFGMPVTFESEFKHILFPKETYGMAGNLWAESYCQSKWIGVFIATFAFIALLAVAQIGLFSTKSSVVPAIALIGVFLAFYIHRNELFFEVLLLRRVAMMFIIAVTLDYILVFSLRLARPFSAHLR